MWPLHDDDPVLRLGHLNIAVADLDRATDFYGRWFGFNLVLAEYGDGTRFITDGTGFELALAPTAEARRPIAGWHFGFLASEAEDVRSLMEALLAEGVAIDHVEDDPGYVGFKCLDPDGHTIEVYWEPRS